MIFEGWTYSAHNTPHSLNSAWLTIFWLTVVPYPEELNLKAFPVSSLECTSFRLTFYTFNSFRDAFPESQLKEPSSFEHKLFYHTYFLKFSAQHLPIQAKRANLPFPHIFILFRPLVEWVTPNHIGKFDLFISLCIQMLMSSEIHAEIIFYQLPGHLLAS